MAHALSLGASRLLLLGWLKQGMMMGIDDACRLIDIAKDSHLKDGRLGMYAHGSFATQGLRS